MPVKNGFVFSNRQNGFEFANAKFAAARPLGRMIDSDKLAISPRMHLN